MGDALDHLANRTKLEWQCNLNIDYVPKKNHRRTSIICTIGVSMENKCIHAGMTF
jgi:hypothetical protein